MRREAILFGAVAALASVQANAATELPPAKRFEPTTAWHLDYGLERCGLTQEYSDGDKSLLLGIVSYGSHQGFWMTLSGNALHLPAVPIGKGSVRFPGDPADRKIDLVQGTVGQSRIAVITFPLDFVPYGEYLHRLEADKKPDDRLGNGDPQSDQASQDFVRTIEAFNVTPSHQAALQLHVNDLAKPLAALRSCVDALYKRWGLDPAVQDHVSRPATPDESDVRVLRAKYPDKMLGHGIDALVMARLMIDAAGKVTSCVIQTPNVDASFEKSICSSLRQFTPALDANGKPVASVFITSVRYQID